MGLYFLNSPRNVPIKQIQIKKEMRDAVNVFISIHWYQKNKEFWIKRTQRTEKQSKMKRVNTMKIDDKHYAIQQFKPWNRPYYCLATNYNPTLKPLYVE